MYNYMITAPLRPHQRTSIIYKYFLQGKDMTLSQGIHELWFWETLQSLNTSGYTIIVFRYDSVSFVLNIIQMKQDLVF